MKIARIPLKIGSRFHFGDFRIDINVGLTTTSLFAHSDTLFSAIINCAVNIEKADYLINEFKTSNLNISSLFYYLKRDNTIIYFLPKPCFLELDSTKNTNPKIKNKIKFVSIGVWESGFLYDEWENEDKFIIIQGVFIMLKSEFATISIHSDDLNIFELLQTPKNPVRKTGDESIYYQTDLVILNNQDIETGFYFFYETNKKETEIIFKNCVNILSKTGLGGQKNSMGQQIGDPEFDTIDFSEKDSKIFVNISLISPKNLEEYEQIEFYKTILRGGRRLKSSNYSVVKLIEEGAKINGKISGKLVEIGKDDEDNIAFRNGVAFLIPLNDEN